MPELELVPHLLYEKEDNGILWIKFNRPDRLNAVIGGAELNGTIAKVGEYMRAGDDDPELINAGKKPVTLVPGKNGALGAKLDRSSAPTLL